MGNIPVCLKYRTGKRGQGGWQGPGQCLVGHIKKIWALYAVNRGHWRIPKQWTDVIRYGLQQSPSGSVRVMVLGEGDIKDKEIG